MKLYLVFTNNFELIKKYNVKYFLVSYYYIQKSKTNIMPFVNREGFLLDSGAYSAFTKNININIDQYIDFIKKNRIKLYFNLDVIGDHKKSLENQKYMEEQNLNPIPVFHFGEPFSQLEYLAKNYDYIALGGVAQLKSRNKLLLRWLGKCFSIIPKNVKVHGLAVTNPFFVQRFRFYSIDSSRWNGRRWGVLFRFNRNKIVQLKLHPKHEVENNRKLVEYNLIEWTKYANYLDGENHEY